MFDPHSFKTEIEGQEFDVEISHYQPAHDGGWDEPPEAEAVEYEVVGLDLIDADDAARIEREAIDHLKWAAQEVELERQLSALEGV